ncbi:hypothetical protein HU200_036338 [Digitaria exilis]|uniref:KIB1-4 beta-propeller domain-containing protein n=1 Tax=Digitaria exilis TaxID=1010633 RepID=A0A835BLK1_9POAL|nr:hypothetical protein HU200_036338 [Digitaria exilis]
MADLTSFSAVCQRWREAAKLALAQQKRPLPTQIPWLLLPPSSPSTTPSIFSFISGVRRGIRSFPADFARERLIGCHPGGWVAAALGPFGPHLLANVFSGVRVCLPHRLYHASFSTVTPVMVRAIVLSAGPTATAAHCVAGAIVSGTSNLAFCRPGVDSYWHAHGDVDVAIQDMVYYAGVAMKGFHVLTDLGEVQVMTFNVTHVPGRQPFFKTVAKRYMMDRPPNAVLTGLPMPTFRTGYLVESRGKLLMVLRYYTRDVQNRTRRTVLFRVYEMQVKALGIYRQPVASWTELDGLDGRVLFVGRGCSRAFEASQIKGFNGGSIYYLDDAEFDAKPPLQNGGQYHCTDMGMYSMGATATVRPGGGAPTDDPNMSPGAIYGAKTYLSWVYEKANDGKDTKKSFVETTIEEEAKHRGSESKIIGTRWSILSEPQSKFSPAIWLSP